jgi:hypothetical protein
MLMTTSKTRIAPSTSLDCSPSGVALCLAALLISIAGCQSKSITAPVQPSAKTTKPVEKTLPSPSAPSRPSGPITFTDVTAEAGIHFKHNSGAFGEKYLPETMGSGACVIDYDNDGWQDILFVNSKNWPGHGSGKSFPALYHNNHNGTFTDVTRQAGLDVEMYGLG